MADATQILIELGKHSDEVRARLGDDDFAKCDERRRALVAQSAEADDEADEQRLLDVLTLLHDFPAAEAVVRERDPGLLPPIQPPVRASEAPAVPAPESSAATANDGRPAVNVRASGQAWTPELKLQAFKEGVTALIGLMLIGFTIYLAARTLDFAGNTKVTDAKDLLQLMVGLAGVVLGYYFGRIPAEARATQSEERAEASTQHAAKVTSKAGELAAEMESRLGPAYAVRGDDDLAITRRLAAELRALSNR